MMKSLSCIMVKIGNSIPSFSEIRNFKKTQHYGFLRMCNLLIINAIRLLFRKKLLKNTEETHKNRYFRIE